MALPTPLVQLERTRPDLYRVIISAVERIAYTEPEQRRKSAVESSQSDPEHEHSTKIDDLQRILATFLRHLTCMTNVKDQWTRVMQSVLSDIADIVGPQALIPAKVSADSASIPTSFLEELNSLRGRVGEIELQVGLFKYRVVSGLTPIYSSETACKTSSRLHKLITMLSEASALTWEVTCQHRMCALTHFALEAEH